MIRRLAITALLAVLAAGLSASPASGMVVYNESESGQPSPVGISFSCGWTCSNSWKINIGSSGVRPGKGGYFAITSGNFPGVPGWDAGSGCEVPGDHPSVSTHGWGELHHQGDYAWRMYGNDNQEVSGSPFVIGFGIFIPQKHECDPNTAGSVVGEGGSQAQQ